MNSNPDEIYEKARSLVSEKEKGWFDAGSEAGKEAYEQNAPFDPDLSHFVTEAQTEAFVKGYTTTVRILISFDLDAISNLEANWNDDDENIQKQEEEKQ